MNVFGKEIVTTIEPENVKQVLSLGFRDWGIGEQRKKVMEPFLGEGIFTTDGAEVSLLINSGLVCWKRAPSLTRQKR